ncbi:MAG: hypothetical protein AAF737_04900 [Pseudomonadota bacterium]
MKPSSPHDIEAGFRRGQGRPARQTRPSRKTRYRSGVLLGLTIRGFVLALGAYLALWLVGAV